MTDTLFFLQIYRFLFGGDLNSSHLALLRLRRSTTEGGVPADILGSASKSLLPPFMISNYTDLSSNGLSAVTAAEFAGILQSLKTAVSAQVSTEALTESVVRTLLENRELFGHGDMLTMLKLLLHTVENQKNAVILQPQDFAQLLKVSVVCVAWCGVVRVLCAAVRCSEICMCGIVCVLVDVLLCIYAVVCGWVCIVMCVCVCVCVCVRARVRMCVCERESGMVCVSVNVVHMMLYLCMDESGRECVHACVWGAACVCVCVGGGCV